MQEWYNLEINTITENYKQPPVIILEMRHIDTKNASLLLIISESKQTERGKNHENACLYRYMYIKTK